MERQTMWTTNSHCESCGSKMVNLDGQKPVCGSCGKPREDVTKNQMAKAKEAIIMAKKTTKKATKKGKGRGRAASTYSVTSKKPELKGQGAIVFAAVKKLGNGTAAQITAAVKSQLSKSKQTPERVVAFYLSTWSHPEVKIVKATPPKKAA